MSRKLTKKLKKKITTSHTLLFQIYVYEKKFTSETNLLRIKQRHIAVIIIQNNFEKYIFKKLNGKK